jgi:hypothetical protein
LKLNKQEHKDFLVQVVKFVRYEGNLEQIEETARLGKEVLEAIEKAEIGDN